MSIQDLIDFIRGLGIDYDIYPYVFPSSNNGECMTVETAQTFNSRGSVYDGTFTITVRARHPQKAEEISLEVIEALRLVTNVEIGGRQIIQIKTQQVLPSYLGKDRNMYYYINNFTVLIT